MIVSIYLKEHGFLKLETPQTLNFGGKYLYNFEEQGRNLYVTKKLNEKYIPDFFNISGSQCKINLLSAIVGANGVGKSSVLDIIRNIFANSGYNGAFPHNLCVVLVEENGQTKVLYKAGYTNIYIKSDSGEISELEYASKQEYQSIYYSPHFDLKYNPDFDEVDKYDISLDRYIKQDLENIDIKGTNENGWKYLLHFELKYKNAIRVIEFMNSALFSKSEILNIFNLKAKYEYIDLIFRDIEVDESFSNTPQQFRSVIQKIKNKAKEEVKNWTSIRRFDKNNRVENQSDIKKYILRRYIIQAILSVICRMLEVDAGNFYLEEGEIEKFEDEKLDAEQLFLFFVENAYVNRGIRKKIVNGSLYQQLFSEINNVLEPTQKVSNQEIKVKLEGVIKIIKIHRDIVKDLLQYFEDDPQKNLNLYEFISINPNRGMSSGEIALLNIFSRLYYFKINRKVLFNKQNYILLLDEADLGFHPIWKKKYVNAILKALPHFFENLLLKPNLQIIITTHDPLSLSDLPMNNVVFIQRRGDFLEVVPEENKVQKTFGANITDLLAHSFFVENGLIGDFAKSKIEETIIWINENKTNKGENFEKELEYHKKIINLIDERVLKLKLTEMITELVPDDHYHNQIIEEEIKKLKRLRK